ncbi:DUF4178 domain-containing protein [Terasakiella sp. A23]|uniref:DUF4178 domain-containing protein n=1 Tax=Terasakiella sp. FCG-A23 TaxID=3080561 RepID=UPI002954D545|nr:DUF4178 domain-containing protein [Terasakiella sp. A23]MDV7339913.1 DUF4178 domain-containing protein [Terasakiella sp. A23]
MSSTFLLVLIIIAVIAFIAIWMVNRKSAQQEAKQIAARDIALPDGQDHTILNLRKDGVFSLRAFGNDMDDLDVHVLARHLYSDDDSEWFELEGEAGGRKVWLTVFDDDELEISITLEKKKIDAVDVTMDELETYARKQDKGKSAKRPKFDYEGRTYKLDCYDEALFHKNSVRSSRERYEYWEFESDDETRAISVEKWSDGSVEVHVSQTVNENQITVFSVSGGA